ncbi:MAG TPA: hypothetical protein VJJ80_01870 [Patescibacteria group bacterium]|nr:hypothetical protein [Patescibacteria group bacterium]
MIARNAIQPIVWSENVFSSNGTHSRPVVMYLAPGWKTIVNSSRELATEVEGLIEANTPREMMIALRKSLENDQNPCGYWSCQDQIGNVYVFQVFSCETGCIISYRFYPISDSVSVSTILRMITSTQGAISPRINLFSYFLL